MRRRFGLALAIATCFCGLSATNAQPPGEGGGGRGGFGRMPPSAIQTALDANADGQISADELKDAEAKLKKLDANSDGVISMEELRPAGMRGGGGPGGPGGFGGQGGPGGGGNSEGLVATIMGLDANKDGKVTKEEAPERLQGLFERADADKDGALTKAEIEKTLSAGIGSGPPGGRGGAFAGGRPGEMRGGGLGDLGMPGNFFAMISKRVFEQQDLNKDGKIGAEELTGAMKENLNRIDANDDGAIELSELESLAKVFEARPAGGGEHGEGPPGRGRPERE
jgi:Ca2+-binding EF-hand superfamily protein